MFVDCTSSWVVLLASITQGINREEEIYSMLTIQNHMKIHPFLYLRYPLFKMLPPILTSNYWACVCFTSEEHPPWSAGPFLCLPSCLLVWRSYKLSFIWTTRMLWWPHPEGTAWPDPRCVNSDFLPIFTIFKSDTFIWLVYWVHLSLMENLVPNC